MSKRGVLEGVIGKKEKRKDNEFFINEFSLQKVESTFFVRGMGQNQAHFDHAARCESRAYRSPEMRYVRSHRNCGRQDKDEEIGEAESRIV